MSSKDRRIDNEEEYKLKNETTHNRGQSTRFGGKEQSKRREKKKEDAIDVWRKCKQAGRIIDVSERLTRTEV